MSLIKVDLPYTIFDGAAVSFKSPADFSEVTGLRIYYPNTSGAIQAADFTFADANRNDVTDIDKLFGAGAIVKVILDTDSNLAFIQNADTNAYLEGRFAELAPGFKRLLTSADDCDNLFDDGVYVYSTASVPANAPFANAAVIEVFGAPSASSQKIQRAYRYGAPGYSAFRALYDSTWQEWTQNLRLKSVTVSKTTNENGNLQINGSKDTFVPVCAYAKSADGKTAYKCNIYSSVDYGGWWCHVRTLTSDNVVSSETISLTYYYIES